jgi:hypothetical protein
MKVLIIPRRVKSGRRAFLQTRHGSTYPPSVDRIIQRWLFCSLSAVACSGSRSSEPRTTNGCDRTGCVEVIYKRTGEPRRAVQVDEVDVYWSEVVQDASGIRQLEIFAAPKSGGGAVRNLGPWDDYQAAESMVLDATHVSFLHDNKLVRVRKDGSQRVELTIPNVEMIDPGPLLDAGDTVLVGGHACKFLARIPKDGSPGKTYPVSQRTVTGGDTGLEANGPLTYCASGNHVQVLDTRSGEARELVAYGGKAGAMRRVSEDLYWADFDNPDTKNYAIVRLSAGSDKPVAVAPAFGGTTRLLFDETRGNLYWLTGLNSHGCTLGVHNLAGGKTSTLGEDFDNWGAPSQDHDYVYWPASRSIMRAHK